MNCDELKSCAYNYFESQLSEEARAAFEAHSEECADCGPFVAICREITCEKLTEFLDDYVDDHLPAERKAVFERHLAICDECVAYVRSYRITRSLTEAQSGDLPPYKIPADLLGAILAARKKA